MYELFYEHARGQGFCRAGLDSQQSFWNYKARQESMLDKNSWPVRLSEMELFPGLMVSNSYGDGNIPELDQFQNKISRICVPAGETRITEHAINQLRRSIRS